MPMLLSSSIVRFHCIVLWLISIYWYSARVQRCVLLKYEPLSISKVGHNVGEINWYMSALKVIKSMPRKFLDCLSSAWLTGFITEGSQTTQ